MDKNTSCEYCDDTGDVHSIDGEWRGTCVCPAGRAQRKSPDANTEAVRDMLLQRSEFGLKKYGQTTADSPLSLDQWALHAAQESMDHAVYLMAIIRTRKRNLELAKRLRDEATLYRHGDSRAVLLFEAADALTGVVKE